MSILMVSPAKATEQQLVADVSANNAAFSAAQYASAGHILVTVKATEGTYYVNPKWEEWAVQAHEHKLAVNHYHFARPEDGDPVAQAQAFWKTVRPHFTPRLDRAMVDIETGDQATWPAWLKAYDDELLRLSGIETIGYTYASALSEHLVLRSQLWMVAAWGTERPAKRLQLPCGTLWGWQYTGGQGAPSGGPLGTAGIPGACDMTVLRSATVRNVLHDRSKRFPST
jgi:GH25 family lysozyme M1 (1,4-beta-N-acetylmuramidase)